jgi:hypothetical protein
MEPFDSLSWPYTVTENGQPRVINNGTEYREHLILMQHRLDFQADDLRRG